MDTSEGTYNGPNLHWVMDSTATARPDSIRIYFLQSAEGNSVGIEGLCRRSPPVVSRKIFRWEAGLPLEYEIHHRHGKARTPVGQGCSPGPSPMPRR